MSDNNSHEGKHLISAFDTSKLPQRNGTFWVTLINTIKSIVGTGVLTLPYALRSSGLINGIIAFVVVGMYSTYSMWLISESFYMKPEIGTYGQLCESVLGWYGRMIGGINIVLLEILVGAGYLVFVGLNLATVAAGSVSPALIIMGCMVIISLFMFQSDVSSLGVISSAGNLAIVSSLAIILYYAYLNTEGNHTYTWGGDMGGLAVFLGSTVFMFSGHAEVIAIVKPMKDRAQYPRVLIASVSILFMIYFIFGLYVYISFGETTEGLIFNNMDGRLVDITKVFHSLAILFSIPVKLWPAFEAIELNTLGQHWEHQKDAANYKTKVVISTIIRVSVLLITGYVAIAVPDFAFLVAFCGSFCISLVGLVLPPLLYILISQNNKNVERHLSLPSQVAHWLLFMIGVTVCVGTSGHIIYEKIASLRA